MTFISLSYYIPIFPRKNKNGGILLLFLGSVWLEEWKSERMEKWEDGKYLVFPRVCLVGRMEKWEDGKLFCLVEKKSRRIEKVVYIN